MVQVVRAIPIAVLVVLCLTLGLAPFVPEPHLLEKLRMLAAGELTDPVDVFDLFLHGLPFVLLLLRLVWLRPSR
jgi:hypothetical protein